MGLLFNGLSGNFTKWSNTLKLFECVWPFCGIGAYRVKLRMKVSLILNKTKELV